MNRLALLLPATLLALTLSACAAPGLRSGGETLSSDRSVVRALAVVEASESQQAAVLAAYDPQATRRREIERELQQLDYERLSLDPRQAEFPARAETWITRWTALTAEKLRIQAGFDRAVSQILDERQWREWSVLTTPRTRYGDYRDGGGVPTRGERP